MVFGQLAHRDVLNFINFLLENYPGQMIANSQEKNTVPQKDE